MPEWVRDSLFALAFIGAIVIVVLVCINPLAERMIAERKKKDAGGKREY